MPEPTSATRPLSRRQVLLSGVSGAAVLAGSTLGGLAGRAQGAVAPRQRPPSGVFALGVASGDPLADGVVLWTRLAPDPLGGGGMPQRRFPVQWQVANDERFTQVVREGTTVAVPEGAHSVHVEVAGLAPGREYFYRFRSGPELSPVGRTKTAPPLGAPLRMLRFAFASCQNYTNGSYTAYRRMAEEDLDLVVHLGDYIYEGGDSGVRPHAPAREIISPEDYRIRHAQYRTDPDLQAAHAAFPFVVTWDDHEVENNYADETSQVDTEPDQDPAVFRARRAAAYQAYYEHLPLRRPQAPRGPDVRLYRRLAFGDLAEFNVLETRQYRDDQACGDGLVAGCAQRLDPARSLTGEEQERWLRDGLAASSARWKVVAQQVFFAQRDFQPGPGEGLFSMDAWDGYVASRDRIMRFVQDRGITDPVVLTGDVHSNWACELTADFADPNSPRLGTEFVGTSISSGGNGADTNPEAEAVLAENPHIKFFNGQRGYVRCALTPEAWQADYRVLPFINPPGAPVSTRASFMIESGRPALQRLA